MMWQAGSFDHWEVNQAKTIEGTTRTMMNHLIGMTWLCKISLLGHLMR